MGRPTGGGAGNPLSFELTGGALVRFSTGDFRRSDGSPLEGRGVTPDLPVSLTAADCAGPDRDVETAVMFLQAANHSADSGVKLRDIGVDIQALTVELEK